LVVVTSSCYNTADFKTAVVVFDISIKNQVAILITYIHISNDLVIKTLYHTINIMTTEAELFAIRCGINQAMQIINVHHIIITTDSIHAAKRIFNLSIYLYQIQSTIISRELRELFYRDQSNSIKF